MSSVDGALVNPYDKLLADSNSALARARRNVLVAQAHLDAVKTHRERIKNADVEAKAEQVAATTTDATTARQQLIQQREQALFELSGLGRTTPVAELWRRRSKLPTRNWPTLISQLSIARDRCLTTASKPPPA